MKNPALIGCQEAEWWCCLGLLNPWDSDGIETTYRLCCRCEAPRQLTLPLSYIRRSCWYQHDTGVLQIIVSPPSKKMTPHQAWNPQPIEVRLVPVSIQMASHDCEWSGPVTQYSRTSLSKNAQNFMRPRECNVSWRSPMAWWRVPHAENILCLCTCIAGQNKTCVWKQGDLMWYFLCRWL